MANITAKTVVKVASDFNSFGRMFQELTIDAAKNALRVIIKYAEQVRECVLMSRRRAYDEFNVLIEWANADKAGEVRTGWKRIMKYGASVVRAFDEGETGLRYVSPKSNKRKLFIHDSLHILEGICLKRATVFAQWAGRLKPHFSDKLMQFIANEKVTNTEFRALRSTMNQYKNYYRSITSAMSKELNDIRATVVDLNDRKEYEKAAKARYRQEFDNLANEIRRGVSLLESKLGENNSEFKGFSLNRIMMATIDVSLHHVVIDENGNKKEVMVEDQAIASNFAHDVLQEEFTLFMLKMMKQAGEKVPEYTEDKLTRCSFEEGDEVEFVLGEASDGDKYACAEEDLDGTFVIRKNDKGKLVASKRIEDLIEVPKADPTQLTFITKGLASVGENVNDFLRNSLVKGKEVTLLNYALVGMEKVKDVIVVDGEVVSNFRPMFFMDRDKKVASEVNKAYNAMYGGKVGTIKSAVSSVQEINGVETVVAIVTLENVRDVKATSVKVTGRHVYEQKQAANAHKRQVSSAFANAFGIQQEAEVPKKTRRKLAFEQLMR